MADFDRDSMQELFIYEMSQLLEQLEQILIECEDGFSIEEINEVFRIMHTIKGSAAMMMYNNVSTTAHSMEDLFFYLREENPSNIDFSRLTDLMLEGLDFIKVEFSKIESGAEADGNGEEIISRIKSFLKEIKGEATNEETKSNKSSSLVQSNSNSTSNPNAKKYRTVIFFEDGVEMENVRAFTFINNLKEIAENITHSPSDILDEESIELIKNKGFEVFFETEFSYDIIHEKINQTVYLRDMELEEIISDDYLDDLELNIFEAILKFDEKSEMENVRALILTKEIDTIFEDVRWYPENIESIDSLDEIRSKGFKLFIRTSKSFADVEEVLSKATDLTDLVIEDKTPDYSAKESSDIENKSDTNIDSPTKDESQDNKVKDVQSQINNAKKNQGQTLISVAVSKLDQLLNLMGELVIAEAMVTQNPELEGLELDSFHKETRQLRKIINDVQDTLMSMRMMPLSNTFFKMNRIVRDMCKSLDKDVKLEIIGEETEVDKNIIEHISDPLMHIIRNSIDHGIESPELREERGKSKQGTVILEAKNSGGDVLITIKDDGNGLNKEKIMAKAKANGLLKKSEEEYSEKEIYQFIFLPGFSTNEVVTGYSGRGVGMDVVFTNLEAVGGSVIVDSFAGEGSIFTLKIPLTLAIIEGMTIRMGDAKYTIPINSIKQSFKPSESMIFNDPSGNEMITVRGECYNVVRLSEFFNIDTSIKNLEEGIMIMIENDDQTVCILVDELIGEQQVVVKTMPKYIKKIHGITGCTLLGNGDISLIIDSAGFFDK